MALIALDDEIMRRKELREQILTASSDFSVPASLLHLLRIKAGQRGVYRDSRTTDQVVEGGIALSLHHTGRSYVEDLSEAGIAYHYPVTKQKGTDNADILSIENAFRLRVPLFVIEDRAGSLRKIHWGWVQYIDAKNASCYVAFEESPPSEIEDLSHKSEEQWSGLGPRTIRETTVQTVERDPKFKFLVRSRYGDHCAVTGIEVLPMLDAAHVVEVQDGGKDQAINGILLEAGIHRAFDAYLWTIEPGTLRLVTRDGGPTLAQMGIRIQRLDTESVLPAKEAIQIRWEKFQRLEKG